MPSSTICACCYEPKEQKTKKYCNRCEARRDQMKGNKNNSIADIIAIIRAERNIKVVVHAEPLPVKPPNYCPCCWGKKTGEKVVCMFSHCTKADGFNAGRVRLRGD